MTEASGWTNLIQAPMLEVYEKVLDGLGFHRYIGVADRTHSLRWPQHLAMQCIRNFSFVKSILTSYPRDVWVTHVPGFAHPRSARSPWRETNTCTYVEAVSHIVNERDTLGPTV